MKQIRLSLTMLFLSVVSVASAAKSNPLIEEIYLGLPDEAAVVEKSARPMMIKGGLEQDINEPVDTDTYRYGVLMQDGNHFFVLNDMDAPWEGKVINTDVANEKLVYVRQGGPFQANSKYLYRYNTQSKTFTPVAFTFPATDLDDVIEAPAITEANRENFEKSYKSYVWHRLDAGDNAIWMGMNTDYIEDASFPKERKICYYIYWDGSKFVKPARKVNNVNDVRNEYNAVKKQIDDKTVFIKTVTKSKKMYAAIGEQTRVYTNYEKDGKLVFSTQQFNIAARNYYDEYLFDKDGKLRFCYRRYPTYDDDVEELRLYFESGRLIKSLIKVKKAGETTFSTKYEGPFIPENWWFEYANVMSHLPK